MGIVSSLGVRLFADVDELMGVQDISKDFKELIVDFVSMGSLLTDLSEKSGLTTTELQKLAYAGDLAGVSVNQIANAATMLAQRIGTGEAQEGIEAMGLNFQHIKSLDMGEQFTQVATAMGRMTDQNAVAVAGADAFGRQWTTVLPLAKQDLVALGQELENTGGLVGNNLVDTADRAGDAWTRLSRIWEGWKSQVVGGLLEKSVSALEQDIRDISKIGGIIRAASGDVDLAETMATVARPRGFEGGGIATPVTSASELKIIEQELNRQLKEGNRLYDERAKTLQRNKEFLEDMHLGFMRSGLSSMPGQMLPWQLPPQMFLPQMTSGIPGGLQAHQFSFMTPEQYAQAFEPPPGLFERVAEKLKLKSATSFGEVGMHAAQSIIDAVGQGLQTGNWSSLAQAFASSAGGFIAHGVNLLIPGLGTLLQPLFAGLTSLLGGLFDRHKGRDQVVSFAESMGGFDALHAKLLQLGADGEALWVKLTQGTPSGNKDIAMQNIQLVTDALNRQKVAGAAATDGLLSDLSQVPGYAHAAGMSLDELNAKMRDWTGGRGGFTTGMTGGGYTSPGAASNDIWNPETRYGPNWQETIRTEAANQAPTVNMTVNGTADKQFASLLAKAIADGGSLRTQWQGAVG